MEVEKLAYPQFPSSSGIPGGLTLQSMELTKEEILGRNINNYIIIQGSLSRTNIRQGSKVDIFVNQSDLKI